jgi:hypothetical protein
MRPTRWARIHDCGDDLRHHRAAWDRAGITRLLHAEWTKFRTVRGWVIALCAVAVVFVLLSFLSAFESRAPVSAVPVGPDGEAVSDTYMFVHQALVGDGTLTARVASLAGAYTSFSATMGSAMSESSKSQTGSQVQPGLAPWAKAGIILEPDTDQGTAYAAVMVTGSHGVQMQDNYTHDRPGLAGAVGPSASRWLRLTRAGDVITGYDSTDGANWTEIGTARLAGLPRTVQIGLFVTSPLYFAAGADVGTPSVATARFDQVSAHGDIPRRSRTTDETRLPVPIPPCRGDRRSGHPPCPGRQRELPLPGKRFRPGPGHYRHRAPAGASRGTGRRARHDAAPQRRSRRRSHRAPLSARYSRLAVRGLADAVHPDRGLRHPGHPAPLQPGHHRLHTTQRLLPYRSVGRLAVLAAYTAVTLGAATWLLRRRDA